MLADLSVEVVIVGVAGDTVLLSTGVNPIPGRVTVTAHPLVWATVKVVVSTCVLVMTAVEVAVARLVSVRVIFVVWVCGTREKKVRMVDETAVMVSVVSVVRTDTVVDVVPLVTFVTLVAVLLTVVAFGLAEETEPVPQRPYPRMHPTPQCSLLAPHQPSAEQQSPDSDPMQVWLPPCGPQRPSRVKPETDGVGVAAVELLVPDGMVVDSLGVVIVVLVTVGTIVVVGSEASRSSTQYLVPAVR